MKLVYLFLSDGCASPDVTVPFTLSVTSTNKFLEEFRTDGWLALFQRLVLRKTVDEVLVVLESCRGVGSKDLGSGVKAIVIPQIHLVMPYINQEDIVLVRHGFKTWPPILQALNDNGNWVLFYRAASNRGGWPYWDIVLDDLIGKIAMTAADGLILPFKKPTHPDFFLPRNIPKKYDVCIGASHIHDRKGQWKVVDALVSYREKYGKDLKCVLPGRSLRGENTNRMFQVIEEYDLSVELSGMVNRLDLTELYSASKLLVHMGAGGQNDRSILECLSCGTPVLLRNLEYHPPDILGVAGAYHTDADTPDQLAVAMNYLIRERNSRDVCGEFDNKFGLDKIVNWFGSLIDLLNSHPRSDRDWLKESIHLI